MSQESLSQLTDSNGKVVAFEFSTPGSFSLNLYWQEVYADISIAGYRPNTNELLALLNKEYRIPRHNYADIGASAALFNDTQRQDKYSEYRKHRYEKDGIGFSPPSERIVTWANPSTLARIAAAYTMQQNDAATGEIVDMLLLEWWDILSWNLINVDEG